MTITTIKQLKRASFADIMQIKGEVYRDVNGRKTLRFEIDNKGFFIKQHSGVGWREIFKNILQLKLPVLGAKNEYLAINKLKSLQIDTLQVVGFAQRGVNPASLKSYLITEELANTISLEDYCKNWTNNKPAFLHKLYLIKQVAKIVKKLHDKGINHRDLYICHFLLASNKITADNRLFLIDLHRTQIRKCVPTRWLLKDLAALYFSALHIGLTQHDFLRFIKIYRNRPLTEIWTKESMFWHQVAQKAHILNAMPAYKNK